MNIKPFQAVYPKKEYIASTTSFFGTVKEDYPEYRQNGFFDKYPADAIFIYQIEGVNRHHLGLITLSDIENYLEGKIIKHEKTKSELEQKQLNLLFHRNAAVKPILLTYEDAPAINAWMHDAINKPPLSTFYFKKEKATHKVWAVEDKSKIKALHDLFEKHVQKAYIADGHHRSSTSAIMYNRFKGDAPEQYRYFLTAFFPFSELDIFDYNRIVEGLNGLSPAHFMARLSKYCNIRPVKLWQRPKSKHQIMMCLEKEFYLISWRNKTLEKAKRKDLCLDTAMLDSFILDEVLGISDIRNDTRVKYVGGPNGMEDFKDMVLKKENRVGFMLHPVSWQDFLTMGDAGKIMPPKSTWFEPRMKNGILVQEL